MRLKKLLSSVLLLTLLMGCVALPASAEYNRSKNPMVDAQELVKVHQGDDVTNVLLLGIEYTNGNGGETMPSGYYSKRNQNKGILAYHTDAVMLLSVNRTQGKINLISVPRDTITYVPGVYGVYKINGAFNTGSTVKEGFRHVRDAVSWLLGGEKIDTYVAVDMDAMIALGDAMGGVDFDLDFSYEATSGKRYQKGFQHLDGLGMMDFVRVRQKAPTGRDLARTERGRRMVSAIIDKLWGNWDLVNTLWNTANSGSLNFFTDIEAGDLAELYQALQDMNNTEIGSYVLDGQYGIGTAVGDFQFHFVDETNRIQVLKDAFGFDAQPLEYASLAYMRWMYRGNGYVEEGDTNVGNRYYWDGFDIVKHLHNGQRVLEYAYDVDNPTAAQQAAIQSFEDVYNRFLAAFEEAADRANTGDAKGTIPNDLRKAFEDGLRELAKQFNYPENIYFGGHGHYWEQDKLINECYSIIWS